MKISEHFNSSEFDQPSRHNIKGLPYPPAWIELRLKPLCIQLEIIRTELGNHPIEVISGYRSPEYNKAIGGATASQHMQGKAADIIIKGISPKDVHDKILELKKAGKIKIGGLGEYNTFTHVDIREVEGLALATWSGNRVLS